MGGGETEWTKEGGKGVRKPLNTGCLRRTAIG